MKIIECNLPRNGPYTRRSETRAVVLHHAEASSATVWDINSWHLDRGFNGIGYHYYVRKDGSIYRGRSEWAIGAHAIGANDWSIGVCCEGAYMTETMPAVQLSALKALLRDIMARNGRLSLVRHKDVSETDCPGSKFPWAEAQKYEEDDEMNEKQVREIFDEMFNARLPRHKSVDEFSGTVKTELQDLIADGSLKGKAGSDAAKGLDLTDDMARALVIAKRYTDGVFDAE
ncbi:peptidoglycan recognition family protein [Agathobaculum sp. NTUH-O15-33]|uniref:peptidoglycan recognition protein family protein n=1 Tax=Agathobaculum sp. NTUH-O15-33 TaxID=3079302 RepID=UPI00295895E6|nr:peptidoglycan recognition family protein [Agathobaculum sp. NTUH-O15-33]WNX85808.1 peptidoglycan recognition family protein [Agathobaculum sp. NTUH-O15-33]